MGKKTNQLLGLLGSFAGALVGSGAYYFLLQYGFTAAITSIVGVMLSCKFYRLLSKQETVGIVGCLGSIIFNIAGVLVATYVDVLKEISSYLGVTLAEAVPYFSEVYGDLLRDYKVMKPLVMAIIIILLFSLRYSTTKSETDESEVSVS